ncbi:oligoendopeptidase, M3 family [Desulfosporosinus orientis DSM 765]|uniref:Oligoendopeptidase, M3 family n=1 Tax=Desulfosporosinus orientis (strain ATCC 19365 / DSM 765 / NCIMB 8382 / VKM B-1628 / Singapore I) TaxID=768706 RepID=G7W5P2_DESOD|nr:M3 family oligoendopeptidase [Desulfosporosinus orientis]AET66980.1 oligoendopeptidase, M3 family [Desulfosporosinus orientis DSM 765]
MKFKDFQYQRPDLSEVESQFNRLLSKFDQADDVEEQTKVLVEINELRSKFESMEQIVHIRHTVDTTDPFYEKEQTFFDEGTPIYQGLISRYYHSLVNSRFRQALEEKWGKQLFVKADLTLKTFTNEIIEDLQLENKLSSDYTKLLASAKILFGGEERNLPGLVPFQMSRDRGIRKRANEAKYTYFKANEGMLDDIYDRLVKVRTQMAEKLGYADFIELGYARMLRSDYSPEMVANFRKQVKDFIVPLASKLRERQRKRLGLKTLAYYDEKLSFLTGNAVPHGDAEWIVANGGQMYRELSPETGEFFQYMTDHELMDLVSKKGKAGGGYCTYISDYQAPYIFSNFNGTSGDIDVLTHEAGHAFQVYCSKNYPIPEYHWPTYEACEIHSMSMEFFTWPWMNLFFQYDTEKYKFNHLSEALLFIPYGVCVDEFQHYVYAHPEASPQDRKTAWRELEKIYLPHRNYEDNDYLELGSYWHQQGHIFGDPFYYIDYTLAQICAFQFWKKSRDNRESAWAEYLRLCRAGGSQSFLELVKLANLDSPFRDGCISSVVKTVAGWLDEVDDTKL